MVSGRVSYRRSLRHRAYRSTAGKGLVCEGVAAIVLLTEDPQLTDVIAESYNRIKKVHDEIGDDGWA